jgi:hypothetical protein
MKAAAMVFLILGMVTAGACAECGYFRVSTDLIKCTTVDAKKTKESNPYLADQELPELKEPDAQTLIQVTCNCSYTLMGSDQRCDPDQEFEKVSVLGADRPADTCRQGRSLCKEVCPPRLP